MTEIKMGEYQSRNDLDEDSVSNFSCSPEDVKKYYIPSLQKQIQQLQADNVELNLIRDKLLLAIMYTDRYENLTIEGLKKKFGIKH